MKSPSRPVPVLKVTRHGKPASDASKRAAPQQPDLERIRTRAYLLWEQEGRPHGRDQEHWQEAERQLAVEFRIGFPDGSGTEPRTDELAKPGDLDIDELPSTRGMRPEIPGH
jgi:hypothetical protein